ncbi:hypothetical protein GWG54_16955 [Natronococcus sp. JC468]|uniref:hypothetical protein n=1 Tax=Natronococcus sp. JC468 TaxID=1961921 RepID=UPI001438B789|nr:hypothetical protein [Natronococcus sp. JC468]NKE37466.1 hypothetical protein [Natronococcus sp. JC468]
MDAKEDKWDRYLSEQRFEYWEKLSQKYQKQLKEFYKEKQRQEERYSILLVTASLTGALLLLVVDRTSGIEELALILTAVFAVIAFGAALGIARWALYDLISAINALR